MINKNIMDEEIKINLVQDGLGGVFSYLIKSWIMKKKSCNVDIKFNKIQVIDENGRMRIHADMSADMSKDDFMKLIQSAIKKE